MAFIPLPPPVPAGTTENPFPLILEELHRFAYSSPSPGLEVRLWILIGISAGYAFIEAVARTYSTDLTTNLTAVLCSLVSRCS